MDSQEKQDLMDEFGANGGDAATVPQGGPVGSEQARDDSKASGSAGTAGDAGDGHEFDPAETVGSDENTVTDRMVFDVIHDVEPPAAASLARIGEDPTSVELSETKERLLRLAAEFENFKKRRIREREEHLKFANERLLKDFLPVVDNLERALESARQSGQGQAIVAGLELVIHEFLNVMAREGVVPVESVGKPFDPSHQDALQQIETSEFEPGTVAAEVLKGYLLNGRVLRAALVVVAREPQARPPQN